MNTEAFNALKQVREVANELQMMLNDTSLTRDERFLLEQVLSNLYELEDIIIELTLQAMVDKINESNESLKKLIADMKHESDNIAKFAATVQKVSDVVGVLAQITEKAIDAGLV
jgi:hypothetical protein